MGELKKCKRLNNQLGRSPKEAEPKLETLLPHPLEVKAGQKAEPWKKWVSSKEGHEENVL